MTKLELRKNEQDFQHLNLVRELRADESEKGIIEGYIAVWEQVDSYNSRFQRGSFKKTIQNRTDKIKVLYNHDIEKPIGKLLEIKEDDHGVFVRAQLVMEVENAKDTFNLIKGGAINALSFGFRTVKDKFENGIQVITEVQLGEISPVVFPGGEACLITGARSTDFNETDKISEMHNMRYRLINSLAETLEDIYWLDDNTEPLKMTEDTIDAFRASYLNLAKDLYPTDARSDNELINEFRKYLDGKELETIALTTSLTVDELKQLKRGSCITNKSKLIDLPDEVQKAHEQIRSKAVITLCDELRAGLSSAESTRIEGLLKRSLPEVIPTSDGAESLAEYFDTFNASLK